MTAIKFGRCNCYRQFLFVRFFLLTYNGLTLPCTGCVLSEVICCLCEKIFVYEY